ncbi:uncharacterized protein CTRU02_215601 [Colletotrichum truncatum]|uniref:Uncharacterized protein n=1 Tax=Colletotrichum truncatum TaxID=5467 RepID=A0ACC3YCA2_COLTU|nr:uncharacterized protein CTRU02_05462 [Colletotrichum truncatum]KAF6793905.1 hypothetical protein CTRU02_05462 [Colletotrichum truncatum]
MHAQVIVPTDFNLDKFPDSPTRRVFSTATSLAAVSMFSVYVPHNVLSSKQLGNLVQAIPQFASLSTAQQHEYNRMVDLRGLYNGKGGKEFTPEDQRTPATIESQDDTIPFNTQRYPDLPPAYEECLSEGQQSRARSDVAAISADSPVGDRALSDYGGTERNASKHVLHRGSEDSDLPLPKRNAQLSENMLRSRLASLARHQSTLELRFERQCQEFRKLQEGFKELQRQNKKLEGQGDDVEEYCCVLEKRQVENGEAIESVAIHADELAGEFEELGKQLLDVCDEVKDWAENNMPDMMEKHAEKWLEENMAEKYMEKWFEENMGEKFMEKWLQENMAEKYMEKWFEKNMAKIMKRHIDDQVAAKIAEMKTKMREALLN